MGVRGTRWHFELSLTNSGWSGAGACHTLGKGFTTNSKQTTGAVYGSAFVTQSLSTLQRSNSYTHLNIHHAHTQKYGAGTVVQARLLWLKIHGGIINHHSLPLVKSSLSWCEQNTVPAEQRRALAGWQICGGMPGLFTTSGSASILWQMDERTMIRTRRWLLRANWDASSTGDRFFCSTVHPTAKWETAGVMEGSLFNQRLFSRKTVFWLGRQSYGSAWKSDLKQLLKLGNKAKLYALILKLHF